MKDIYAWVPWFQELAGKVAEGGEAYLVDRAKQVDWGSENPALLNYGDENIDPFSFFYFLAQRNTKNQRPVVFQSVQEIFDIKKHLPNVADEDQWIFPTPSPNTKALFYDGNHFEPNKLWQFFRKVIQPSPSFDIDELQEILTIRNVGIAKLTQSMFLVNPYQFLTVDAVSLGLLQKLMRCSQPDIKKSIEKEGWSFYKLILENYKNHFPGLECYEINFKMFRQGSDPHEIENEYWLVGAYLEQQDLSSKFIKEGVWENGHTDESEQTILNEVKQIRVGDKIAIKSTFTQKHNLPFDYAGKTCSVMQIKARGTVKENPGNGQYVKVDWEQNYKARNWYFETKLRTIHKLDKKDDLSLINFVFLGHEQEYERWLLKETLPGKTMPHLNRILYGPPGTGKTWNTVNHALAIIEDTAVKELEKEDRKIVKRRFDELKESGQIEMVTFHQNFAYEDFIEGIRPVLDGGSDDSNNVHYEIVDGVFKRISNLAKENLTKSSQNYVLIIDEINRGNIAKIFGELITLIEDTKRIGNKDAMTVALPYSSNSKDEDDSFGVPNNLYIIGTMNTADRSIALLDTALRRRFDFIEMMPQPDHFLISDNVEGVNCQELLAMMNKRITVLLDREHQIGHSYLMDVDSMEKLANVFQNKIIPLLQEYFYDDWAKIDLALNKNKFVTTTEIEGNLFGDTELVDANRSIYELIEAKSTEWRNPENYKKIYATTQTQSDDVDGE